MGRRLGTIQDLQDTIKARTSPEKANGWQHHVNFLACEASPVSKTLTYYKCEVKFVCFSLNHVKMSEQTFMKFITQVDDDLDYHIGYFLSWKIM